MGVETDKNGSSFLPVFQPFSRLYPFYPFYYVSTVFSAENPIENNKIQKDKTKNG